MSACFVRLINFVERRRPKTRRRDDLLTESGRGAILLTDKFVRVSNSRACVVFSFRSCVELRENGNDW